MKKADVKVGGTYLANVSGKVVPVRIDAQNPRGGWDATNTVTKKKVRIKSARRLRGPSVTAADKAALGRAAKDLSKVLGVPVVAADGTAKKKTTPKAKSKKTAAKGKKQMSVLDAAAKVLAAAPGPMNCRQTVDAALAAGYWSTKGKTPAATLYSVIIREIANKGDASRFRKVERGKFALGRQPRPAGRSGH